jgi:uncharacterized protein
MAAYYLDSTALAKLYLREPGSLWVEQLVRSQDQSGNLLALALIGVAEIAAAIARYHRQGLLSDPIYQALFQLLMKDNAERFTLLAVTEDVVLTAAELTRQYPLRGYDSVHLATALKFDQVIRTERTKTLVFVTADEVLFRAAQAAGLLVENPNNYP